MKIVYLTLIAVVFFATSFYKKDRSVQTSTTNLKIKSNNPKIKLTSETVHFSSSAEEIYNDLNFENYKKLNAEVFYKAYLGFNNLKKSGNLKKESHLLTVCDFTLSSTEKRLWVIDLNEKKVLYNSLVAHGKNTGEEFAQNFSNTESSYQSSLGFYITESTYDGKNGYSLKLLGMDKGFNDAALQRAIVMHGADYVSEEFIKSQKRIGRSWGCPAIPRELAAPIINTIKGENCLFIYYPDGRYLESSKWLKA